MTTQSNVNQCRECNAELPAPNRSPRGRPLGRRRIYCSDTCTKRAQRRGEVTRKELVLPEGVPAAEGTDHADAAEVLISAVFDHLGNDYSAADAADATHLRRLAQAIDIDPTNIAGLREWRMTTAIFREILTPDQTDSEQEQYLELIRSLTPPDFYPDGPTQNAST